MISLLIGPLLTSTFLFFDHEVIAPDWSIQVHRGSTSPCRADLFMQVNPKLVQISRTVETSRCLNLQPTTLSHGEARHTPVAYCATEIFVSRACFALDLSIFRLQAT